MRTKLIEGHCSLNLCPATMQAVVQAWLDEELASPVNVEKVGWEGSTGGFTVSFTRAEGEST